MDTDQLRPLPLLVRLRVLIADLLGWRYPSRSAAVRFPAAFGPIAGHSSLVDPIGQEIDCSSMTTYLVMRLYPDTPWSMDDYMDMQVFADRLPARPWSPIEAVERRGVGSRVARPEAVAPGTLCLVQMWRSLPPARPSGHAYLAEVLEGGWVRVWESTSRDRIGPRYRSATWDQLRQEGPAGMVVAALGPG